MSVIPIWSFHTEEIQTSEEAHSELSAATMWYKAGDLLFHKLHSGWWKDEDK